MGLPVIAGIAFCLSQSAIFSGLTIGLFGLSRIRLEIAQDMGDPDAARVLSLRRDSNRLLCTLLWGNVGVNVLLTLLSGSILSGWAAFLFSTAGITLLGEIFPQAFFTRNALKAGAVLVPLVRVYSCLLYPIAKPTAWLLDRWLGKESVNYFTESEMTALLNCHSRSQEAKDFGSVEVQGAANFLALDDVRVRDEGEVLSEDSVIALPVKKGVPVFPSHRQLRDDPFLVKVARSGKKWVVIVSEQGEPACVLDAREFLNATLMGPSPADPHSFCHRPLVVTQEATTLGQVLQQLRVVPDGPEDDVVDEDLILYWAPPVKKVITGADLLGRLLRGIARRRPA
ncbi:MAG: hypothetical protein MOGMAGMI_00700 [Candidatus Omnitrophica bacterium]|nr:hypothetical protein [Candidatus Omnitrophota bacterium]